MKGASCPAKRLIHQVRALRAQEYKASLVCVRLILLGNGLVEATPWIANSAKPREFSEHALTGATFDKPFVSAFLGQESGGRMQEATWERAKNPLTRAMLLPVVLEHLGC